MSRDESFRAALRESGLEYSGELYFDSSLHRFKAEGDNARNSWFVLYPGPPAAGAYGCWKRDLKKTWCERNGSLTQSECQNVRQRWRETKAKLAAETVARQKKARKVAAWILNRSRPARTLHRYLDRKRVKVFGNMRQYRRSLVVPLRDAGGELQSLQFIDGDGAKKFLTGGRIAGCLFVLADKADGPLVICEGYATGASIYEAIAHAVFCAMNSGNLLEVAKAARQLWPQREIIIAADNDQFTDGNPGLTKATAAAKATGAKLAVPQFKLLANKPTDFNDLALLQGLDAVREQVGSAKVPGEIDRTRHYALADLAAIGAEAVGWIEEPYLARGEMHFLQGQGGSYKGTLALTWAAEFSLRGEHVLLILAEDDLAKKVKPLLMAAGADMAFIHPLTMKCGETEDAVVLPDDLDQLEQAVKDKQAALVVIDPLLSHVSGRLDSYRDHDMKRVLTRIGHLAQRLNAVIVCVHHTKKDTSGGMKLAGQGSTAFYSTARLVLAMAKLSEQEVVLEVVKSNLGPEGARQLLRAELIEISPGIIVPRLNRAGESPMGVAEALNSERERNEKEPKTLSAAKLILDILEEEGEQKQVELFDRVARETGLKPASIRRHAYFGILVDEDLVVPRKDGFKGGWLVSRSDLSRPPNLLPNSEPQNITQKACHSSPRMTEGCHATEICHPSGVYEGIPRRKVCHSSCVTVPRVTSDSVCHHSVANSAPIPPREEIKKSSVEQSRELDDKLDRDVLRERVSEDKLDRLNSHEH